MDTFRGIDRLGIAASSKSDVSAAESEQMCFSKKNMSLSSGLLASGLGSTELLAGGIQGGRQSSHEIIDAGAVVGHHKLSGGNNDPLTAGSVLRTSERKQQVGELGRCVIIIKLREVELGSGCLSWYSPGYPHLGF